MDDKNDINEKLLERLNYLLQKQESLTSEVNHLKSEIEGRLIPKPVKKGFVQIVEEPAQPVSTATRKPKDSILVKVIKSFAPDDFKQNIEKFIGENLISVIGVVILIIGVGIGAKYAIDHQMVSPLTRIIIGYLIAVGLLGLAIKLKAKYHNYSAVLLSGALALMYFLTFVAYDFYDLMPKMAAFGMMVVFTIFTTFASIKYNKQVIAHIGFVGAYGVPFLLSDGTGDVVMLLVYVTIINFGILAVSIKNYWKSLYYTAFVFTWLIYLAAYSEKLNATDDLAILLAFLSIYYLTFYAVFIGYKVIQKEVFNRLDIFLLMANSSVFYGIGYGIFNDMHEGGSYLGLFTLLNALIHFGVAVLINKRKIGDRKLFYLIIVLVLTFITIAIPVQLNGHWVTLLWIGEAALLFWIARTKEIPMYEKIAIPLMLIGFISIFQDWDEAYRIYNADYTENWLTPFLNFQFLSSIIVVIGLGIINYFNIKVKPKEPLFTNVSINRVIELSIPAFFLIVLFMTFSVEITNYWDQAYYSSSMQIAYEDGSGDTYTDYNYALRNMGNVWSLIYALFFFTVLSIINYKLIKNRLLGLVNLGFNGFVLLAFLLSGLFFLSELRDSYLNQENSGAFMLSWFVIGIRYVSLVFVGSILYTSFQYTKQQFLNVNIKQIFALVFYITILWLLSSELIHWMNMLGSAESYKLGLSILWGVYALALIVIGIIRKYKQIRLGAMSLFGITLFKLFFYDISDLNTISKTIVFVVLGILLLVISFLYNKFKHLIFDDAKSQKPNEVDEI